jgi:hypothetical protein
VSAPGMTLLRGEGVVMFEEGFRCLIDEIGSIRRKFSGGRFGPMIASTQRLYSPGA